MLEGEEGEDMIECWREIYSGHGNGIVEVWNNQRRMEYEEERSCLLYTSPSPRDKRQSRMPSSA